DRDRQRQTGRERQAEKDRQRQTGRDRQAEKDRQRQTGRDRQAETDRQRQTGRDRQTYGHHGSQEERGGKGGEGGDSLPARRLLTALALAGKGVGNVGMLGAGAAAGVPWLLCGRPTFI
ncbi:hypothetical protein B484DRAFT_339554, partial [Ochromonadaceae sp. CCMP2298]